MQSVAKVEPNASVNLPNDVDISLTPEIIERLRTRCTFLSERGVIPKGIQVEQKIDIELIERAWKSLGRGNAPAK